MLWKKRMHHTVVSSGSHWDSINSSGLGSAIASQQHSVHSDLAKPLPPRGCSTWLADQGLDALYPNTPPSSHSHLAARCKKNSSGSTCYTGLLCMHIDWAWHARFHWCTRLKVPAQKKNFKFEWVCSGIFKSSQQTFSQSNHWSILVQCSPSLTLKNEFSVFKTD